MGLDPLVCGIILTRDRPEYLKQATACFYAQSYEPKHLSVLNTSKGEPEEQLALQSIGWLRNYAVKWGGPHAWKSGQELLIAHFDDDDWSAPERLTEQVAFIQATGADVVGYSDLPFYDVTDDRVLLYESNTRHYSPGTALLYKRAVWEAVPFPDLMVEDTTWQHSVLRAGFRIESESSIRNGSPRLIARMHPTNTTVKQGAAYRPASKELEAAVRAWSCPKVR